MAGSGWLGRKICGLIGEDNGHNHFTVKCGGGLLKEEKGLRARLFLGRRHVCFPKNLVTTLKFSVPEGGHEAGSIMRIHKFSLLDDVASRIYASPVLGISPEKTGKMKRDSEIPRSFADGGRKVHPERYGAIKSEGYVEAKTLHRHMRALEIMRELQVARRQPTQLHNNNNNNNNNNAICYSLTS